MQTKFLAAFILIGIAVEGCADNSTAPASAVHRPASVALTSQQAKISHAPIRQRFGQVIIDARTPIKVGVPVLIEVSAPVILGSSSAHMKVLLPELAEIAHRQKFGLNRAGPRVSGPLLTWHGPISRGTLRQTARLVFPVPGLYRVSAQLMTDDQSLDDEGQIQNVAATVSWVYVTMKGGRVVHTFGDLYTDREASRAMSPVDTYLADPSSSVGVASIPLPCDPSDPNCSPCDADPYSCNPPPEPTPSPGTFTGTLRYENQRVHQTIGLANALVTIFDENGGWYSRVFTDATGKFTLQCPPASLRGHLQMAATARNGYTEVLDTKSPGPPADLAYYRAKADAAIDNCGIDTGDYLAGKPAQAELFDNMTRTAVQSRAAFPGFSRDKIMVYWISGVGDSTASDYTPSQDAIHIHELRSVGEVGIFEAGHEYGHALHQVAIGGVIIFGAECQDHDIALPSTYRCAFVEGFADYHAIAVWGTNVGIAAYNKFDQGAYVGYPTSAAAGRLFGPKTEGAVASMLLHVSDGPGSRVVSHPLFGSRSYSDNVSLGNAQVASAIRDCRIRLSDGSSSPVDGIDYLSYCLEKAVQLVGGGQSCNLWKVCVTLPAVPMPVVDLVARDKFFGGLRSLADAGIGGARLPATSWSWGTPPVRTGYDTAVRTVWTCNLFFCS